MKFLLTVCVLFLIANAKVVVTPNLSQQVTEPDKKFEDDELLLGVGVQAYLDENMAVDARVEASSSNKMADGGKTDLERYSLSFLYDFTPSQSISPYLFSGLGYEKLHRTYLDVDSGGFFQAGGGFKFNVTDNIDFITEARYLKKMQTNNDEVIAGIGLGIKFGVEEYDISTSKPKKFANATLNNPPFTKPTINIPKEKEIKNPFICNDKNKSDVVFYDEVLASKHLVKKRKTLKSYPKSFIQVAALSDPTNISKTVAKLKKQGFRVKTLRKNNTTVILVGPYSKSQIYEVYKRVKYFYKDAFYKSL